MKAEIMLSRLELERNKLLRQRDKENQNKTIKCGSCGKPHKIKTLDAIQTYWYTSPYGCTGGDYWNMGELQFICPTTSITNRILFNNYDIPWEDRSKYDHNPESQFIRKYKDLFKSVTDSYEKGSKQFVNNYYVDDHRKKFNLVEKTQLDKE